VRRAFPFGLFCALVLLSGLAHAGVSRVRWRGVQAEGAGPARLESATAAHLALALRSLGAGLVPGPPFDAEALAKCQFGTSSATAKHAQCHVEVLAGELHAERHADIPYRDADDLAESIALLVSGMLQTDLADLPQQQELEPEKPPPPKPPNEAPQEKTSPRDAPKSTAKPKIETVKPAPPRGPDRFLLSVGPSVAVGFSGDPALWGSAIRALYLSRYVVRAGVSLNLEGTDVTRSGFDLSFFRLLAAARVGAGFTQGRVDVDVSVGGGYHFLYGKSGPYDHSLHSFAAVAGARLGVTVTDGLALETGLDVAFSPEDLNVAAGPMTVTQFGRWWLDVALAIVYRR
jgi:hypothetical protein